MILPPLASVIARCRGLALLTLAAALSLGSTGCRSSKEVPEAGAVLLRFELASVPSPPDQLRLSVYDDTGVLWRDARVPREGTLPPPHGQSLGTFLVQPGATTGALRLHALALAEGNRIAEGLLSIAPAERSRGTFTLVLAAEMAPDGDADGVPDALDDCPAQANPSQGGCPALPESPDAATGNADASTDAASDGAGDGAGDNDARREGGVTPADAVAERADGASDGGTTPVDAATERADGASDAGVAEAGAADRAPSCGFDGGCDLGPGAACGDGAQCRSSSCADGVCCNVACSGACRSCNQPSQEGTCVGYARGIDPERECTSGLTCNGAGACGSSGQTGNKANGELCGAAQECRSKFCADGVCCNAACTGECLSCETGACRAVTRGQDVPACVAPQRCNLNGRCVSG